MQSSARTTENGYPDPLILLNAHSAKPMGDALAEARRYLESFDKQRVTVAALEDLNSAFDLLDDVQATSTDERAKNVAQSLRRTYTRSLLRKLPDMDRKDEEACMAVAHFVMLRAFRLARSEVAHEPSLARGYDEMRSCWSEWGSMAWPLLGPEADYWEQLLDDA